MDAIEAQTICPCGNVLHVSIYKPQSFAQKSQNITCNACASKFMATAKRKSAKGEIVFEILDLSEKACEALKSKVANVAPIP